MSPQVQYPLSAVAHQPELLLALSLLAVAPELGGVLIRGDRGAAKSTAARGLASLLPARPEGEAAPFVNLPLGASEDRVVGSLDLHAALRGEARLRSGLIAAAHGGVLYIDEVNLLPDHLVDVLLDAAAMGVHRVQRDGLSVEQHARFALVGSMNPEEGRCGLSFWTALACAWMSRHHGKRRSARKSCAGAWLSRRTRTVFWPPGSRRRLPCVSGCTQPGSGCRESPCRTPCSR
ncbi:ATP-binding protein [Deinococcus malanensis]|uniref:ATP-binding protein n=1 Tax=Deinococcus malanensis TaxID=1706855 RepID=UPI00363FD33C